MSAVSMKLKCWYGFQFAEINSCFQKLNTKEAFLLRVLTFQEIIILLSRKQDLPGGRLAWSNIH